MVEPGAARMAGLTASSLRKHPALVPLLAFLGAGGALATFYTLRLATRNPDVSWNKKTNPEPWQRLGTTGQYKFYAETIDYKNLAQPAERPNI